METELEILSRRHLLWLICSFHENFTLVQQVVKEGDENTKKKRACEMDHLLQRLVSCGEDATVRPPGRPPLDQLFLRLMSCIALV